MQFLCALRAHGLIEFQAADCELCLMGGGIVCCTMKSEGAR